MITRFSLELHLGDADRHRLYQVFQHLAERTDLEARVPRELADFIAPPDAAGNEPEEAFRLMIGGGAPGFDIVAWGPSKVRIVDTAGAPDLKMLCRIIAAVVPSALPLEFSFALIDEVEHRFSGGLVVMTSTSAEIQTIDSMIARRSGVLLH